MTYIVCNGVTHSVTNNPTHDVASDVRTSVQNQNQNQIVLKASCRVFGDSSHSSHGDLRPGANE